MQALDPDRHEARFLNQRERDLVAGNAARSGGLAALGTAVVTSGLVAAANALSPRFRGGLGVSGKVALVVTPTAFSFWTQSHLAIGDATKDPSSYIESAKAPVATTERAGVIKMPAWYGIANTVYTHPFKTIIGLAGPLYGALFYAESVNPATASMPLSQRLIHTRVYGQALVIGITAAVMTFSKSMEQEGAYRLYEGRVVREAELRSKGPRLRHWYSEGLDNHKAGAKSASSDAEEIGMSADLFVPLLYAPLLPLVVIGLRGRVAPDKLNKIAAGVIGVGLFHAGTVMFSDSSMTMD